MRADHFCFALQEVLYCAKKAGVTHILKAGGAQVYKHRKYSYILHYIQQSDNIFCFAGNSCYGLGYQILPKGVSFPLSCYYDFRNLCRYLC